MPRSSRSFDDCRETLDRALACEYLQLDLGTYERAIKFRHRCNHFRQLDRDNNLEIFPEGDARRGRSAYDQLELSIPGKTLPNNHILTIQLRETGFTIIQEGRPGREPSQEPPAST